jgi:hypothetical protein
MEFKGFCGGSASERVRSVNREAAINFYPCLADSGNPKSEIYDQHTPGIYPWDVLDDGPIRALFYQDGRCFSVGAGIFYEVLANHTHVAYGSVAIDGRPATISSNGSAGHQLFITSGGHGYIFDLVGNTLVEISDLNFALPTIMGAFIDGYFVSLCSASATPTATASHAFQLSDRFDGLTWSGAFNPGFGQISQFSDEVRAMKASHKELWFFGSKHTQVWADVGTPNFPLAPIQGALLEYGIASPYCAEEIDNSLFWIGQNEAGGRVVYRAQGYAAQRVSTHAIEFYLSQAKQLDDVISYTYQDEGHAFYHLYVPGLEATRDHIGSPVYDVAGPKGAQWHHRAMWDSTLLRWHQHISRCHAFAFGKHLVGARDSAAIYELNLNFQIDTLVRMA